MSGTKRFLGDEIRAAYQGAGGRAYFGEFAQDEHAKMAIARQRARKLQPHVRPTDSVLEYGVGMGYNLRFLRCSEKWGFDLSETFHEDCARAGITLVYALSALGDRKFDVVICHHVLEHVPDPVDTLGEIGSLLGQDGQLLLHVPFETRRRYRRFSTGDTAHHLFSWNAQTLGNLLQATGFDVVNVRVQPFSYERRLAPLARAGDAVYRGGLWLLRLLRPENEVFAIAKRRSSGRKT